MRKINRKQINLQKNENMKTFIKIAVIALLLQACKYELVLKEKDSDNEEIIKNDSVKEEPVVFKDTVKIEFASLNEYEHRFDIEFKGSIKTKYVNEDTIKLEYILTENDSIIISVDCFKPRYYLYVSNSYSGYKYISTSNYTRKYKIIDKHIRIVE